MKLAEALLLRSDQQKQLASLKQRIEANVLIQEGDEPSEDPNVLLEQAFQLNSALQELIYQIHRTNAAAHLANGQALLKLLIQRDRYIEQHRILIATIQSSQSDAHRYSSREIKWKKTITVSKIQLQADDIAHKLRELNMQIQSANWQIELMS
ncbi:MULTISPECIES: DIP1984 family protein [Acinetobacter]|uniref:DIP1984 family protein n=1 Tax=Acinetobacter TaxID=469 RepID=UPI00124DE129|nr:MULTISPECIES: DIP1984 family protein [Acinetobacter]MCG2572947.1 DIP1984 family protein [Acinetobacter sp. ME22]